MPTTLTIPEQHASGLSKIMSLSDGDMDQLVKALEGATSLNRATLSSMVTAALPSLSQKQSEEVIGTLLSLYSARSSVETSVESFVADLVAAATVDSATAGVQVDQAGKNLQRALGIRPLSMIAKARSIHTDHENTFCNVRILTDLRPVFDTDVKEQPVGFVLFHMLKLAYHHAGRHTTIHVAMDKADIDALANVLVRAQEKATSLSQAASKCGFSILAD